ncbi:hypothetical protein LCGC14_2773370, partial [marine sediment metagenome]
MTQRHDSPVPPPQHNFHQAALKAAERLQRQSSEQMTWLGAELSDGLWRMRVLDGVLSVDIDAARVTGPEGREVSRWWRILTMHYLAVGVRPDRLDPSITFASLPSGRTYSTVYDQRVIGRLCATVGREEHTLRAAAEALNARWVGGGGDLAFDLTVLPRVDLRLIWHAGDDEFGPSATILLAGNIESFFHVEDVVVLSES